MPSASLRQRLANWSWADRLLLVCAAGSLVVMRLAITVLPFKVIARVIGLQRDVSREEVGCPGEARAERIGRAVRAAARHLPWRSTCLVQALAAALLLRLSGIGATLHLGVARDEEAANGIAAHAWLCCGTVVLTGAAERRQFNELASFRLS